MLQMLSFYRSKYRPYLSIHCCEYQGRTRAAAPAWLGFYERFWNQRLDNLDAMLRTAGRDGDEERS